MCFFSMIAARTVFIQSLFVVSVPAYDQLVKNGTTEVAVSEVLPGYSASRAIDGDIRQHISRCSHTNQLSNITEAWLRIDLKRTYSLKSIQFWYREDTPGTKRLPGYSIRVSNDTNVPPPESICYQDPGNTVLDNILQNDCERTAQYVWIYQNNKLDYPCPMLEICEVQVFGCDTGKYGNSCSKLCDHCHNNYHCGIVSGKCDQSGCANKNFHPPFCEECIPGMYGQQCSKQCSEFCQNKECYEDTGSCLHGCERGYNGSHCNNSCPLGTYDYVCRERCGECYQMEGCNHINGNCANGCSEGFKGALCKTMCSDGEFGKNCIYNCSGNCLNGAVCNKYNGSCESCSSGFDGPRCDERCIYGRYGLKCSLKCGNCLDSSNCNHVDGTCTLGCAPGWQNTDTCVNPCNNGTYGKGCMYNCTAMCYNGEFCNKIDGSCPEGPIDRLTEDRQKIGVIAGSISAVAIVVALVTIGAVFIMYRRRLNKTEKTDLRMSKLNQKEIQQNGERETDFDDECKPDDNVYYNAPKRRKASIKITDIGDLIHVLETEKANSFEKEYNMIPYGEQSGIQCTVGKQPHNVPKNRFKTTFPYDHSRIILQTTGSDDYINANNIKNACGEKAYIASQGPKMNTVEDFWQMVWQENILLIAMVTNLTEGSSIKCERYWPDGITEKMVKGKYSIQLLSQKTYSNFASHQLKVINKETRTGRQILHLQYTTWPDHGTPSPLQLLVFYQYVSRAMEMHPKNKLLVHCSAGVGRTGTFIALDALYRQGMKEGKINIVEYVNTMREDRMNMIQNANQYKFLYHVLHEAFRGKGQFLSKDNFIREVDSQNVPNKAVNLSRFRKEFMELNSMKPDFGENEKKLGKQHLNLNMTSSVLPCDKIRIILSSHVPGRTTYINAVPLSTFTMTDCLIAAQYPVPEAGVDLIRLLIDQECTTLVSLNPLSKVQSSKEWVPSAAETLSLHKYNVQAGKNIRLSENVCKSTVKMKHESNGDWHTVNIYEVVTWGMKDNLPSNVDVLLDVVKSVKREENVDQEHKMTVLSRDGATGCGVFCAVYNAIQQLQQDEEVDMFTIVRQLQSRRPEMISSLNEYVFSCQAVAKYIKSESEDVYMNPEAKNDTMDENMYANT
uniref:protein-tyrosine-phosphatase n=2 Tax=Crassostrea virginica TaxID=6565 RepID=A0A8B8C897_CRAVI|nr:receptor-type tyrosine-protein phosphatase alpha-like isoform X2 [Crassostrea virginica]